MQNKTAETVPWYSQSIAGAFFESYMQAAAQTMDKLQNGHCFRFDDGFHYYLAGGIQHSYRDRCLVNIEPNILGVIHEGAPFCRRRCERSKPTSKRGALL